MEEMRAILDSLMGSDRNSLTSTPKRSTFKDPGVCHSYLIDFCPHDLFPNTKSDLGPCPNKHSDAYREQFSTDPEHSYYHKKYEREFFNTLHRLVEGVEERIRKGQRRILGPDEAQLENDKQKKFDQMKDEIASLLHRAQEAGEKGNIAEAEQFTRKVTEIRCDLDRMSNLSHEFLAISNQEKSLRVCPVCGAMQSLGDATSRFESHVSGKQHVGYERIRATYATLKAKYRPNLTDTTNATSTTQPKEESIPEEKKSVNLDDVKRPSTVNQKENNTTRDSETVSEVATELNRHSDKERATHRSSSPKNHRSHNHASQRSNSCNRSYRDDHYRYDSDKYYSKRRRYHDRSLSRDSSNRRRSRYLSRRRSRSRDSGRRHHYRDSREYFR